MVLEGREGVMLVVEVENYHILMLDEGFWVSQVVEWSYCSVVIL